GAELLFGQVGAGFEDHDGGGHFAPLRVGLGDYGAFEHGGVREDGALDFDRRDVLAAADDDVLLAVDDVDIVLFVPDGHVASVKPAVGQDVGSRFGLFVVSVHDEIATDDDLANGLHVLGDLVH